MVVRTQTGGERFKGLWPVTEASYRERQDQTAEGKPLNVRLVNRTASIHLVAGIVL